MSQSIIDTSLSIPFADYTGHATEQLRKLFDTYGISRNSKSSDLVTEVLSFTALAEQRLAEQDARIHHLEALTTTDELTGLYNRRGFLDGFNRTLQSARRYNEEGVLAYIDLDNFKPVNDAYGHDAGDLILRRVGELLLANVRKTDLVGRLGGDEFAVLFVHSVRRVGRKRAEILRQILNSSNVLYNGVNIPIHASLGCAEYEATSVAEDLLRKADRAMYREKNRAVRKPRLVSQR